MGMSGEAHRILLQDLDPIDDARLPLTQLWGRRGMWQVKIRWFVVPLIVGSALLAKAVGFEFRLTPVLFVAAGVLAYNLVFFGFARKQPGRLGAGSAFDKALTTTGMLADYSALLLLLQFTGGVSSPILVFLIFHVIIAAIQFRPRFSFQVAAIAATGVWLQLLAQVQGWWKPEALLFRGQAIHVLDRPLYITAVLLSFTATLFLSATLASWIMYRFRLRVGELVADRTQFMLQTAHNLRAPLGAGLSLLDLVQEGYMGPVTPEQQDSLAKIDARLRSLHQMIGEILTIAKTRDWSREITDVVVDLKQLARRTEEMFRDEAAKKKIHLQVQAEDDLPDVDSGANLLEQVMENLVSNAIKYTPENGNVSVRFLRSSPGEVRIMVEDDGIGIPAGEQDRLFQEFFRASNAKKVSVAGTGLGLALVKKSVERHRGRIALASEVGEGTTVVIDLPVRQPKPAT